MLLYDIFFCGFEYTNAFRPQSHSYLRTKKHARCSDLVE